MPAWRHPLAVEKFAFWKFAVEKFAFWKFVGQKN